MAKLLMTTSVDPSFPAENVLTTNPREFWISTGLFPQELLFHLSPPLLPRSIRIISTNVRQIAVEGCESTHPGNFTKIGETELGSNSGDLQRESVEVNAQRPVNFVKVVVLSGWDEFVSVHSIKIE